MEPFRFTSCVELQEMLGRRARDEQELLEHLEDLPLESITCHTASRLLAHEVIESPYTNDFAEWAAREVRDQVLGERLGIVEPFDHANLSELRDELVLILDDHLSRISIVPRVVHGQPFDFMKSWLLPVPTDREARTLEEFATALRSVDTSVLYYHTVDARLRRGVARGDFAAWLESAGYPALAGKVARLSPFSTSLEAIRARLVELVSAEPAAAPPREAA